MYGLVIEGVRYMIREQWDENMMNEVLSKCRLDGQSLDTHYRYSEKMIPNMLNAVCEITGMTMEEVGILTGRYFIKYMVKHGYGELMHVMGRRFTEFLKGLDNLHEYFRFSYPKIRPPSFYCSKENANGMTLHYRSRRQGYISYVMGILMEIANRFFKMEIQLQVKKKQQKGSFQFVIMKIRYDNNAMAIENKLKEKSMVLNQYLPVDSFSFLAMFPFFIAFNKKLEVVLYGRSLMSILPHLIGQRMDEQFDLQSPCIKFTWDGCMAHLNCNFQMESLYPIKKKAKRKSITFKVNNLIEDKVQVPEQEQEIEVDQDEESEINELPYLQLRGPIIYLKINDCMIYLPTCIVEELDNLFAMGLFLNDYGKTDCNQEMIIATIQKTDDLKIMLRNERERSQIQINTMTQIEESKKKTRELLCQMMPKEVANTLITTGQTGNVCKTFKEVTIAFAKVYEFIAITQKLSAADVVNLLNKIYSHFDELIDRHGIYKVETIGESYMVSSGIPYPTEFHAEFIGDASLDMIATIKNVELDSGIKGKKVQIKIGIYSGPCVGGIVGNRAPRYCLFGDTVNCASRMESHNKQPMTIQTASLTKECMERMAAGKFKFKHRGVISLKGKGEMKAYGLIGKVGRPRYQTDPMVLPEMEDEQYDERELVYTPIERTFQDRASTMSRMSMGNISSCGDSRMSSRGRTSMSRQDSVVQFETHRQADSKLCEKNELMKTKNGEKAVGKLEDKVPQAISNSGLQCKNEVVMVSPLETNLNIESQSKEKSKMKTNGRSKIRREKKAEILTNINNPDTQFKDKAKIKIDGESEIPTKSEKDQVNIYEKVITEKVEEQIDGIQGNVATKGKNPIDRSDSMTDEINKSIAKRDSRPTLRECSSISLLLPVESIKETMENPPIKVPEEKVRQDLQQILDTQLKTMNSQTEKLSKDKKALPPIDQSKQCVVLEHEHGNGCCKCSAIHKDSKLKTKICSIM